MVYLAIAYIIGCLCALICHQRVINTNATPMGTVGLIFTSWYSVWLYVQYTNEKKEVLRTVYPRTASNLPNQYSSLQSLKAQIAFLQELIEDQYEEQNQYE